MSSLLYQTNGAIRPIEPCNRVQWTMDELAILLGGTPEAVSTTDGRIMFVNDQHKLLGFDLNIPATQIYINGRSDVILGAAVVVDTWEEIDNPFMHA